MTKSGLPPSCSHSQVWRPHDFISGAHTDFLKGGSESVQVTSSFASAQQVVAAPSLITDAGIPRKAWQIAFRRVRGGQTLTRPGVECVSGGGVMARKVLIVDDSKLARMFLIRLLSSLEPDWDRVEAADAGEAMVVVAREQPDVALLDFNMPGKDGLVLAADLRALYPDMAIGIVSANVQTGIIERTHALDAVFIAKPVTMAKLEAFRADARARLANR
jgi:CheY-like chemotaxis protein